jgi:citrate lyase subunit gamma (acyl carrier protein)
MAFPFAGHDKRLNLVLFPWPQRTASSHEIGAFPEKAHEDYTMNPKRRASAGTLESSDLLVLVQPAEQGSGRRIDLESVVILQFGESIRAEIDRLLDQYGITDVSMTVRDKGALAPTITARVETAICRAVGIEEGTAYEAE